MNRHPTWNTGDFAFRAWVRYLRIRLKKLWSGALGAYHSFSQSGKGVSRLSSMSYIGDGLFYVMSRDEKRTLSRMLVFLLFCVCDRLQLFCVLILSLICYGLDFVCKHQHCRCDFQIIIIITNSIIIIVIIITVNATIIIMASTSSL